MKSFIKSFYYAIRGIFGCILKERNMRVHTVCMLYMYFFLFCFPFFEISKTELCIIFLANALVIGGELINTSIEAVVDLNGREYTEYGKIAKDCGSGAVLVFAVFSVLIGVAIMYQPKAFTLLGEFFRQTPLAAGFFIISFIGSAVFIFYGFGERKKK